MTPTIFKTIAGDKQHPLVLGGIEIPCYVLDDEKKRRVLSQRGMFNAFSIVQGGSLGEGGDENKDANGDFPNYSENNMASGTSFARFLERKWLRPYVPDKLKVGTKSPILIRTPGGVSKGYPAESLPLLCTAIIRADRNGSTTSRQRKIVDRAYLIAEALAVVGITSLIDEATGFQKIREERALAQILERFIEEKLRSWVKTFPDEFYTQLHRLWPTESSMSAKNHPQFFGTLTNKIVYRPLAPGVLERLRELNPILSSGLRLAKHHQYLTEDFGVIELVKHLEVVIALMKLSGSKESFFRRFDEIFSSRQMKLPFDEDIDEM